MAIDLDFTFEDPSLKKFAFGVTFFDKEQKPVASTIVKPVDGNQGVIEVRRTVPKVLFATGKYSVSITVSEISDIPKYVGRFNHIAEFAVKGSDAFNQSSFILPNKDRQS